MGMNLWDFDNTIYDGESVLDFFLFCLKKKKGLVRYFPEIFYTLIMYKMGFMSVDKLTKAASKITSAFIKYKENFDELAEEFWSKNDKKLKPVLLSKLGKNDLITTFSPEFVINAILPKLKVAGAICSDFDTNTGQLKFANFGKNKAVSFKNRYPNTKVVNFYTDHKADTPLMELAENAFFVKGDKITKIP
jgi:phosphoserine phosphatase